MVESKGNNGWITQAWNGVKKEVIIKSFNQRRISCIMDWTEENIIFKQNDVPDNYEELACIVEGLTPVDESARKFYNFCDR